MESPVENIKKPSRAYNWDINEDGELSRGDKRCLRCKRVNIYCIVTANAPVCESCFVSESPCSFDPQHAGKPYVNPRECNSQKHEETSSETDPDSSDLDLVASPTLAKRNTAEHNARKELRKAARKAGGKASRKAPKMVAQDFLQEEQDSDFAPGSEDSSKNASVPAKPRRSRKKSASFQSRRRKSQNSTNAMAMETEEHKEEAVLDDSAEPVAMRRSTKPRKSLRKINKSNAKESDVEMGFRSEDEESLKGSFKPQSRAKTPKDFTTKNNQKSSKGPTTRNQPKKEQSEDSGSEYRDEEELGDKLESKSRKKGKAKNTAPKQTQPSENPSRNNPPCEPCRIAKRGGCYGPIPTCDRCAGRKNMENKPCVPATTNKNIKGKA